MMNKEIVLERLKSSGIIPVMRNMKPDKIVSIVDALLKGGLSTVEITIEQDGGIEAIREVKSHFGEKVCIGAGTVMSSEDVQLAIEAGADFIVTPIVSKTAIVLANQNDCFIACGALTPTEIHEAYLSGADLVKVFPADTMGVNYFKNLKGPLKHIPLMPTGGINIENLDEYVKNGAICVGVGSAIYQYDTNEEITNVAKEFVATYRNAK
jgi:2-dehydro-3-deoxyphosphogluconate aldolase/(4S)-4-hydroxy-2-oxoglutarate aldolase